MNKTIKKIVALGMGATMLAGTAAMALAASDLSTYPAPFVKDGVFVGKIVLGEKAVSIDTIGALDIAASLQRAASTTVSSSGSATHVSGGFSLDTSGDRIYLGDRVSVDSATKDNLDILKDNTFEDSSGTDYGYTQSIVFGRTAANTGAASLSYGQHSVSSVDSFLAFGVSSTTPNYANGNYLYTAKVDFSKAVNASDADVIGQKIVLFGKEYTFSSESSGNKLVLYGSSEQVSMTPADAITKTIEGKDYAVKIIGFSSTGTKVTIQVNDATDSITEGTSKTIGGLKIYAKSVSSWNNGIDGFATLQLGAEKLTLEDGQEVTSGTSDTSVTGARVAIGSSDTSGNKVGSISSIYVSVNPNSDIKSIKEGGSFADPVYGTFALQYTDTSSGLTDASRDLVEVRPSGSSRAQVTITPQGGSQTTLYFAYEASLGAVPSLAWDQNRAISAVEGTQAQQDQYIYLSPAVSTSTTTDAATYTHLVRVKNIKQHASQGEAKFEDAITGAEYATQQGKFNATNDQLTLTVDGKQYNVTLRDATSGSENVSVTYPGAVAVFPAMQLKNGETIALTQNVTGIPSSLIPAGTVVITPTGAITTSATVGINGIVVGSVGYNYTEMNSTGGTVGTGAYVSAFAVTGASGYPAVLIKEPKDTSNLENVWQVATTYDSNGVNIGTPSVTNISTTPAASTGQSMADTYTTSGVDYFGTYYTRYAPSGNNAVDVKFTVPADQMFANFFVAPTGATTTTTTSTGAVSLNPISVGMAIFDSEAVLDGSKPYIVVGGPCANTAAASLMGNPADCAAGFVEGKATIKLFADKNALLVAGFTGKDTQGACRVLANYQTYALSGTEVEVVTANLQSLSVKTVSS